MNLFTKVLNLTLILGGVSFMGRATEVDQARIPYQYVRLTVETKRLGVFKLVSRIVSDQGDKQLPPLAAYIDSKTRRIPIAIREGEIVDFPFTDELSRENPFVVVNRPKGTVALACKPEFEFKGDYEHPYQCEFREVLGVSVFYANLMRLAENKPPLSAEELHGWAPGIVVMETAGKKAFFEIKSRRKGALLRTFSNGQVLIPLNSDVWQENPPVLLAFKSTDVQVKMGEFPPRTRWPYKVLRSLLETKRAGVYEVLPICYPKVNLEEWPSLEVYVDAKSGRIPLKLDRSTFQSFPFTDELSRENPFVVINRPAETIGLRLIARYAFESNTANQFKCRYREFMEPGVFWARMERASGRMPELSVDEMQFLPFMILAAKKTSIIEINSRKKRFTLTANKGEKLKVELDKELWRENPEVILHFHPQDFAPITIGIGEIN